MNSLNQSDIENCLLNLKNESSDFSLINQKSEKLLSMFNEQPNLEKRIKGSL
jgi:hypothetical protein